MKDAIFIQEMLLKGNEAKQKVKNEFSQLSFVQLNWKPNQESWSIGQCLDHLIVADCLYFPVLKKITEGHYEMNFWETWNPFSGFLGKALATQVQEKPKKKLLAPVLFLPSQSDINQEIMERFHKHLDSLLEYITGCSKLNIDKIHITSPASKLITYSLRNAFQLLIQHEHRHINQAIKVKTTKEFPSPTNQIKV